MELNQIIDSIMDLSHKDCLKVMVKLAMNFQDREIIQEALITSIKTVESWEKKNG